MTKLFMIQESNVTVPVFFKTESEEKALKMFSFGFSSVVFKKMSPIVKEIKTLEEFLTYCPEEFLLNDDTSY